MTSTEDLKAIWAKVQQAQVTEEYERIAALLTWSSLFGYPIDMDDQLHLVVGAFHAGQNGGVVMANALEAE